MLQKLVTQSWEILDILEINYGNFSTHLYAFFILLFYLTFV